MEPEQDWFARATLLLQLRRPAEVVGLALQRLRLEPHDVQAHLTLTQALLRQKHLAEALEMSQATIRLAPEEPEAFSLLAQIEQQQGNYLAADTAVGQALRLQPARASYYAQRSCILWFAGQYEAAEDVARSGLHLNPQHPDCLMWLGMALNKRQQYPAADAAFARLLALAPNSAVVRANVGACLSERRQPTALSHLREALRLDPTLHNVQLTLQHATLQAQWWHRPLRWAAHQKASLRRRFRSPHKAQKLAALGQALALGLPLLLLLVYRACTLPLDWRYNQQQRDPTPSDGWFFAGMGWAVVVVLGAWLLPTRPPVVWTLVGLGLLFPARIAWLRYRQEKGRFPLGFLLLLSPGGNALLKVYGQLGATNSLSDCRGFLTIFGTLLLLYLLFRPSQRQ
jgi:tetratricopeptide (TPR) repeat protein